MLRVRIPLTSRSYQRAKDVPVPQKPTIRDVARVADVSLGTISNYLNGTKPVSPKSASAIESAIQDLGFIPNSGARVMRGARSHAIGFIIPDITNPFFIEVARGIEDVAFRAGHVLVTCNTFGDPLREDHYARSLSEMRVMGAIVTATTATESHLKLLASSGAALVVLGAPSSHPSLPTVSVDGELGGHLAMSHLLELGHRDIVLVGGPAGDMQIGERFEGAHRAWREMVGTSGAELRRVDAQGSTPATRMASADVIAALDPMPTAVLCANDVIALAISARLSQLGFVIPDDISVVGYDDIDGAQLSAMPLTTIRQPQYDIGHAAAEMVLALARGETLETRSASFDPVLMVRASTGAPRGPA